jgi:hypothetical protein
MKATTSGSIGIIVFVLVSATILGFVRPASQALAMGGTAPCTPCNTWGSAKACFLPPPNVPPPCCDCDKNFTSME